jgi:hypothetical protein
LVAIQRMLDEIAKCDLVCVLCHRFRTARRAGWSEDQDLGDEPTALDALADDS